MMTHEMHLLGESIQEVTLAAWPVVWDNSKYDQDSRDVLETLRNWAEEFETWWQSHDEDGDVKIEAYITTGYDDSVGVKGYAELEEVFDPDDFYEAVDACPFLNDEERFYIHNHMQDMVDDLECGDFKFYEVDED